MDGRCYRLNDNPYRVLQLFKRGVVKGLGGGLENRAVVSIPGPYGYIFETSHCTTLSNSDINKAIIGKIKKFLPVKIHAPKLNFLNQGLRDIVRKLRASDLLNSSGEFLVEQLSPHAQT